MSMPDLRSLLSLARRGVVLEVRLYRALARWVARRRHVPQPLEPWGYARAVTPVMWLWIFASAVEVPLVHLLIPWDTVRIVVLVLSIWGLVWMVGMLASLNVYPHLLGDTGLRVRHGATVDITVPWEAVAEASVERRDLDSTVWTLQPRETERGTDLQVAVSGQVNVHLVLAYPLTVPTPKGPMQISDLRLLADDPRALVTRARQHLGQAVRMQFGVRREDRPQD